jgi:hypothetical protein
MVAELEVVRDETTVAGGRRAQELLLHREDDRVTVGELARTSTRCQRLLSPSVA